MNIVKLKSNYKPVGDQIRAVERLAEGVKKKEKYQVLLGVTGSGKTFTVANVIEKLQMPTLLISHNKTLAAQLYQEFRDYFPDNAVSYFVSYYDYYQPEAYIPSTDTYIEKDADVNDLIDKLRLGATTNIMTRNDVIVISSVSSIYNIGSPREYSNFVFDFRKGLTVSREQIITRLVDLQYERGEFGFHRGTFRVRGEAIEIYPAYHDDAVEVEMDGPRIVKINLIDPASGEIRTSDVEQYVLFPAKHFMADPNKNKDIFEEIKRDRDERVKYFLNKGKDIEAHRIKQKTTYEIEMIEQVGYVKGIENYSRYFDGRSPGDPPFTLIDYFREAYGEDFLVVVDESHITFPQVRGMHAGDLARKKTLVEYGFRLPAAFDNRPLMFEEFMRKIPRFMAVSATPGEWEISMAGEKNVVEQLLRPTGIPDPDVEIRPTKTQVEDVIEEVKKRAKKNQRTLITTLTKRMAEDLSGYLDEQGLRVHYIHSEVNTLERTDILDDLRSGKYDVLVGINLLREGLDLPEVALVAILDADREGFLRSEVTLIQTMGRAARHIEGHVIMYADRITGSMERALDEVRRRREYQLEVNKKLGIVPKPIIKPIREKLIERPEELVNEGIELGEIDTDSMTPMDKKKLVTKLRAEMKVAANDLNFELAAEIRDKVREIENR